MRARASVVVSLVCVVAGGAWLFAGPLNPPAGPIASTGKTLGEVEPRIAIGPSTTPGDANSVYRITQPGSYVLTENVLGVVGKHGIEIAADGVTIDLRGLVVQGVTGSLSGLATDGARSIIRIEHGAVGGWGESAVDLAGEAHHLEEISASGNAGSGLRVGSSSSVRNCTVVNTLGSTGNAILTGASSTVDGCIVTGNNGNGLALGSQSTGRACAANGNARNGIVAGSGSVLVECTAQSNGFAGINASDDSVLQSCSARFNGSSGIIAGSNAMIEACEVARNQGNGLTAGVGSVVRGSVSSNNTASGFAIDRGSRLESCSAFSNDVDGVVADEACTITGCTVRSNGNDAIQAGSNAVVTHNTCSVNGASSANGAGVHLTGTDAVVEKNILTDNDVGILVDASVNLIIANACRGNAAGNFQIATGNRVGIIVVPTLSGAITGNGPGAGLGTTDPWANFAY